MKKSLEDRCRLEVADREAHYRAAKERAERLADEVERELSRLRALCMKHPLPLAEVEWETFRQRSLRKEMQAAEEALTAAEAALAVAREQLTQASLERRKFERLREKHFELYRIESGRREQSLMDEVANRAAHQHAAAAK